MTAIRVLLADDQAVVRRGLRTILEALPVAVFLSDAKGDVVFTNPAVDRIWGMSSVAGV